MPENQNRASHTVHLLPPEKRAQGAEALAQAFLADPMWSYIVADEKARPDALRRMFDALIRFRSRYGLVYSTPEVAGVACWGAPGAGHTLWRMLRTGFALPRVFLSYDPQTRQRAMTTLEQVDRVHKELMPEPHWYLEVLGVAPDHQSQGVGGALLEPLLARAEAEVLPCYLETLTESNAAFYSRRGFRVVREQALADSGLTVWYMAKKPGV